MCQIKINQESNLHVFGEFHVERKNRQVESEVSTDRPLIRITSLESFLFSMNYYYSGAFSMFSDIFYIFRIFKTIYGMLKLVHLNNFSYILIVVS